MDAFFTKTEKAELTALYRRLMQSAGDSIAREDVKKLKNYLIKAAADNNLQRNNFGMNPVIRDMQTAVIVSEEIGMKGSVITGIMLHEIVKSNMLSLEDVRAAFGDDVASIIKGLVKTNELYAKSPAIETENFRNLLLSFAEDMRVILIMIADRVNIMRLIKHDSNEEDRIRVANEAAYLYAPLAHKLGLYKIKSELEDLYLKYSQKETYYFIKDKLNETKASRDKYIASFIEPIQKKVADTGLTFEIKDEPSRYTPSGTRYRSKKHLSKAFTTSSPFVSSLIRSEKEKQECWQVYSIVTDMYQPNPKRLRDWLSIPKSNGYESLHITVMAPKANGWRCRYVPDAWTRLPSADWLLTGVTKASRESGLDEWLTSVREALENSDSDSMKVMDQFKMDLYEDEVFVFTPKGDLFKLGKGATVLDFAFHIHSKLGSKCIGAKVNGKNAQLKQKLNSGDQVEIMTSNTQTPKQDWLNIVTTSKAKTKIRQALKEMTSRQLEFAKETIERKFKNRKMDYDEAVMMRLIKRMGYKTVTEFYQKLAEGALEVNDILDRYVEQQKRDSDSHDELVYRSARATTCKQPCRKKPVARKMY
jgi:GTP pyrophosphokinase